MSYKEELQGVIAPIQNKVAAVKAKYAPVYVECSHQGALLAAESAGLPLLMAQALRDKNDAAWQSLQKRGAEIEVERAAVKLRSQEAALNEAKEIQAIFGVGNKCQGIQRAANEALAVLQRELVDIAGIMRAFEQQAATAQSNTDEANQRLLKEQAEYKAIAERLNQGAIDGPTTVAAKIFNADRDYFGGMWAAPMPGNS